MLTLISRPLFLCKDRIGKKEFITRISARLRGQEVAEYLGAKYNPKELDASDTHIYIKPRSLDRVRDGDYVDVLDGDYLIPLLKERPKVKVIAMSLVHYRFLREKLDNEIVLIYHHHINFERVRRNKNEKLVGGFIGSPSKVAYDKYHEMKGALEKVGIDMTHHFHYRTRDDMVDYYKSIDFLVIWYFDFYNRDSPYRHPTKMLNAASFGIPTLAQPILGYEEMEGNYLHIEDIDSLAEQAVKLKDEAYYSELSDRIYREADKYHISVTTKEYRKLCAK